MVAGPEWGAALEKMPVPRAVRNSWENQLHHQLQGDNAVLLSIELRDHPQLRQLVDHRAVGVVYRPQSKQLGNYVPSLISERYDAFLFLDRTQALHPLPTAPQPNMPPDLCP